MKILCIGYCADEDEAFWDVIPVPDEAVAEFAPEDREEQAKLQAAERWDKARGSYASLVDQLTVDELTYTLDSMKKHTDQEDEEEFHRLIELAQLGDEEGEDEQA